MKTASNLKIVYVSCDSFESAKQIARILVTEKLAACCSIIPNVISFFGWQNVIQERHEYLIIIKTVALKLKELKHRIIEIHTDEVPEIIAVPITDVHEPYMNWMLQVMNETETP